MNNKMDISATRLPEQRHEYPYLYIHIDIHIICTSAHMCNLHGHMYGCVCMRMLLYLYNTGMRMNMHVPRHMPLHVSVYMSTYACTIYAYLCVFLSEGQRAGVQPPRPRSRRPPHLYGKPGEKLHLCLSLSLSLARSLSSSPRLKGRVKPPGR